MYILRGKGNVGKLFHRVRKFSKNGGKFETGRKCIIASGISAGMAPQQVVT